MSHLGMHHYGCSDYAVTADGGDFTVHAVWGIDSAADIWLIDGWHGKTASDVWIESQLDLNCGQWPSASKFCLSTRAG